MDSNSYMNSTMSGAGTFANRPPGVPLGGYNHFQGGYNQSNQGIGGGASEYSNHYLNNI